jgi:hypothetical protein
MTLEPWAKSVSFQMTNPLEGLVQPLQRETKVKPDSDRCGCCIEKDQEVRMENREWQFWS